MKKILILTILLVLYVNATVLPFDKTAVEQVFQNKKAALVLFTNDNDESNTAR